MPNLATRECLITLNIAIFIGLLGIGGSVFLLSPKEDISVDEKRTLAKMPAFSLEALEKGTYFKEIDNYVADNFILRQQLTELAGQIKALKGAALDDIQVVVENKPKPLEVELPKAGSVKSEVAGGATTALDAAEEQPYQNVESIIIYKGRAVQMVGGSAERMQSLSKVVSEYQNQLGPDLKIYFMAIPVGADFYLPAKISRGALKEKLLIDSMYSQLPAQVTKVDAYKTLSEHVDEYTYFKTDHHWTGLGAYYAFEAFLKAANLSPLPMESLAKRTITNFLGTLYQRTQSPVLRSSADTVEYFVIPNATKVQYFNSEGAKPANSTLYAEFAKGSAGYGVFLGGDYPLLKIKSDVNNGKKIILIKDSYGNAFAPYLASRYEEVYVIDYRSYRGNIRKLIQDNGIQNLIFAHNTYVMQSKYTANQERSFLKQIVNTLNNEP